MFQVLVAEDELWIRDAVAEMVDRLTPHFTVAGEVSNGEEAWDFIQEHWPSIVITDIMMPHKNGIWLSEQIYQANLPLVTIVVSGYDNFQYAKQVMRFGITEYLLKPVDEEELHAALKRSVKKLEGMKEIHEGVLHIQRFVEHMSEMSQSNVLAEIKALLASILSLRVTTPGMRKSLLAILSAKLNGLLQAYDQRHVFIPLTAEDEAGIHKHFADLMDEWLLVYPQYSNQHVNSAIKRVRDHIDVHYFENFSLAKMADIAHMSVSHFSMLFKKTTGQTCLNYLNMIRITKAKELLKEPDLKIYEIADMIGYSSLPYFNRIFKQMVTITPVEYRKRIGL
ncbi:MULTISPECIES: response regulator transcription factor [Paenibacillus]|uniref:Response regulator n=1 Tax=Paenibacillus radicis (ex Xue et al. 2023) TaxID=2972489 RepID=A0ABT1YM58_9BACL|nr:response regulator [Paenibacillus radicis (ex Xue et al. 2023)]MCR8633075.1 response regulator [Paenibacillus radicis (ex Xue et al. 2023)]